MPLFSWILSTKKFWDFGIGDISSWKFLAECNVSVMMVLFVNKWKLLLIRALSVCFSFFLMVFKESAFHRRSEDKEQGRISANGHQFYSNA